MGKDIDERIVEMRFNNRQFESGVQQTTKSLENLKQSLNLKESAKNLKDLEAAGNNFTLDGIGRSVDNISSKFNALGVVGFTVLQNLTNSALNFSKSLINQLTIAPVSDGFKEYEMTLGAVQTTMAGTGKTAEQVEEQLKKLDKYADDTVYSSADMFSNLPKFTNAGVDLEKATTAMIGIANATALAGGDASKASIAFYNLGQSIGTGYLTRMDYNSINNAGIATMEWKKQMIEAAVAQGKLKKINEDSYQAGNKTFTLQSLFIDGLQEQWASADVLMKVFGDYGNTETEIGKKAQSAAQDLRSFTMMMESLKATAVTGWKDTWQLMIGNLDEAKELWTKIGTAIGGFITKNNEARNAMLEQWKVLGGRTQIIKGFENIFKGLGQVLKPINEAFRDIFPATTGIQLKDLSVKFQTLTKKLQVSAETADKIKRTFKGVFAIFDGLKNAVSNFLSFIGKAGTGASTLLDGILSITAAIGDWLVAINSMIKESSLLSSAWKILGDVLSVISSGIGKGVGYIADSLGKVLSIDVSGKIKPIEWLTSALEKLGKFLEPVGAKLEEFFGNLDFSTVNAVGNAGLLTAIGVGISKFMTNLGNLSANITNVLDGVRRCLEAYQNNLKSTVILKIAIAIGILAAALAVLGSMDPANLAAAVGAISVLFVALNKFMASFEKNFGGKKVGQLKKMASVMIVISVAVLILASAVKKLSDCDLLGLAQGLAAVGILLAMVVKTIKAMSKIKGDAIKGAGGIVIFAAAIWILAQAVSKLASLDTGKMIQGLAGVAALMVMIAAFSKYVDAKIVEPKKLLSVAAAMMILGVALLAFAVAVKILGSMSLEDLAKGIIAMGVGLFFIVAALQNMPKSSGKSAAALMGIALALVGLAIAMRIMGGMKPEELGMAIMTLTGALITIIATIRLLSGAEKGAAALLVVSGALIVLGVAMRILGSMSIWTILKALGAMAGTLVVLGVAATLLAPAVPVLLGLAGAVALIGVACAAVGAGVLLLSMGLIGIAASGGAAVAVLIGAVKSLIGLIPYFIQQVGNGLVLLAQVLGENAPALAKSMLSMVVEMFNGLSEYIPQLANTLVSFVVQLLDTLSERMPEFIASVTKFVVSLFDGLSANVGEFIAAGVRFLKAIIDGIVDTVGSLVSGVLTPILTVLKDLVLGIVQALTPYLPAIMEAFNQLVSIVSNAVTTIISVLAPYMPNIQAMVEVTATAIVAVCNAFNTLVTNVTPIIGAIVTLIRQLGSVFKTVFDGITNVVNACAGAVTGTLNSLGGIFESVFSSIADVITSVGDSIKNVLDGISGVISSIGEAALNAGTGFENLANGVKTITNLNLIDMAASLTAVAVGVGEIASKGKGVGDIGTGMKNIANNAVATVNAFSSIGKGAATAIDAVTTVINGVVQDSLKMVRDSKDDWYDTGSYLVIGLAQGMKAKSFIATNAASSIARATMIALNKSAEVESPSKATMRTGKFLDMGLAIGLKKYAGLASNAATSLAEDTLTPVRDFTSDLNTEAMSVQDALKGVSFGNMSVAPVLHTEETVTMNHTFDTLRVEGVNDKGEFVAAADYAVEDVLASLMRRQNRL